MDKKKFLYELLYTVLIHIREEAHNENSKKIFWLSDLIHNLPLKMAHAEENGESLDDIIAQIEQNAETKGLMGLLTTIRKEENMSMADIR